MKDNWQYLTKWLKVLTKKNGALFLDNSTQYSCYYQRYISNILRWLSSNLSWVGVELIFNKTNAHLHKATVLEVRPKFVGVQIWDLEIFVKDLEVS